MAAGAGGGAGGGRHSQQDAQIILKIADADVVSLLQLLIPDIKNAAQKPAIKLRRQGIGLSADGVERVETGDELQIVPPQRAEALEGALGLSGQLTGHDTEQVRFDPVGIQQPKGMSRSVPCAMSGGVQPVEVVDLLCAVQREAHEERVGFEKGGPRLIQADAVGLDAVEHREAALQGALRFQKELKKLQPGKGRFAALKQKMDAAAVLGGGEGLFDQLSCHFVGEQPHVFAGPAAGNIVIKAVPAAQVAQAGRWLDEECIVFHRDTLRVFHFLNQGYRKTRAFASSNGQKLFEIPIKSK